MVIKNVIIFDWENFIDRAFVRFDSDILEVGRMEDYSPMEGEKELDLQGHLLMPGFVNAHMHIYSTFARGMMIPYHPKSFKDILQQLWWKLDSKLDKEAVYMSGLVSAIEFIKNGVTTVIDHHASGWIKGSLETLKRAVVDEIGLRGIFCFETSDRFNVKEAIEENLTFMESHSQAYAGMFGLHASLSLSEETLNEISKVLDGKPIHIHVAESDEDEKYCIENFGIRVVERLEKHSLLNDFSILAHCVHVDEQELVIMEKRNVYVAVNVTSNMNNAVGLPKVKSFLERGIPIVVGNDGLGYNITRDYLNLYFSQKLLEGSPIFFNLNNLKSVIDNGYKLASNLLGIHVGRIEKGYKADFAIFNYTPPTPMNKENAMAHVFFGIFDKPQLSYVFVNGKALMENGKVLADEEKIYSEARKVAKKVWKRLT